MLINSCGINSNIMFKTPKGKEFKFDSIPMRPDTEYKIAPDDRLKFYIYPNQGGRLIENLSGTSALIENQLRSGNTLYRIEDYLVRIDGFVNLPIIGDLKVVDLTVKQLEDTLCKYYALQFNQPFVKVELTNKRCIIFTGDGSEAKIIPLNNSNTTLIEALAQAGGIDPRGQAKNIKMIRNINGVREIYLIDLSTIEGVKYADMIVQGNDLIYVEPRPDLIKEFRREFVPLISIISSTLFLFYMFK